MDGKEVKKLIYAAGLKCWQVADAWGIRDGEFSRKLRKPFSEEDVERLNQTISELTENKGDKKAVSVNS